MSEDKMINQWSRWLGVTETEVMVKALELRRLLELKSKIAIAANIQNVVCIDISATLFGCQFDTDEVLKRTKLRKPDYLRQRRTVEKLLDIKKHQTIDELCVQLDLPKKIQILAKRMNEIYCDRLMVDQADIMHPQYSVMAIYQSCKISKIKIKKSILFDISTLKSAQWNMLEKEWTKWLENNDLNKPPVDCGVNQLEKMEIDELSPSKTIKQPSKSATVTTESYDSWRDRMLSKAYTDLAKLQGG